MKPVSIAVVEDSPVAMELIVNTLNSDPRLSVICAVETAEKALRLIPRMKPDVICMDVRLPGMNGIEATRLIMEECPTPIVVVAADLRSETINKTMEALRAGALAVVEKPVIESADAYKAMARSLCNQFFNMSQVNVVRQRFNRWPLRGQAGPGVGPGVGALTRPVSTGRDVEIVAVVASTGGPAAVAQLLQGLTPDLPAPLLIVQHMGSEFLEGYAKWLNSISTHNVSLARNFEVPRPGHVYVAPGHHHLTFANERLELLRDAAATGHIPSGDMLLGSLANGLGPRAIGVLLTGMGDDGAAGLAQMHEAGAFTIAQDEATSVVYGMPAAAMSLGAVDEQLPIGSMASRITALTGRTPLARQAS